MLSLTLPCVYSSLCKALNVIIMWAAVKLLVSVQIVSSFNVKTLKFTFLIGYICYNHACARIFKSLVYMMPVIVALCFGQIYFLTVYRE